MKQLITNIFKKLACNHDWKLYNRHKIYSSDCALFSDTDGIMPTKTIDTLVCKKCGKIKRIRL